MSHNRTKFVSVPGVPMTSQNPPINAADAMLRRMKQVGVDYLFANGGTDFPPILEAYAQGMQNGVEMPEPLTIPHENVAMGMAHGYYLATGRAQAVMVHVNVGLANTTMGAINAASDNIPLMLMSGRTPLTEHDRFGARMIPIHYGQEMRDQASLVRDVTKWDYELRYGEQITGLVDRAHTIANTAPRGPIFLALPREPLSEDWTDDGSLERDALPRPTLAQPDPEEIARAAEMISGARHPLIVVQRGDTEGRLASVLAGFTEAHGVRVCEFWPIRNQLASDHPMHAGYDVAACLAEADLVITLDSTVPWMPRSTGPADGAKVIHIGPDPYFQRMPVRSFPSDLAITSDPADALHALDAALGKPSSRAAARREEAAAANLARREAADAAAQEGNGAPMSGAWVSKCLSDVFDDDTRIFNELGASATFMHLGGPNRSFAAPYSGGLGWGVPAALGAQLADRDRLTIACVGDGSYTFANPVACHQVAESLELPLLTIVLNNGIWNAVRRSALSMYPDGAASKMNRMPITSLAPNPDYTMIAKASRGWAERVEDGKDLPDALERAVSVVRNERRQALLEVATSTAHVPGT